MDTTGAKLTREHRAILGLLPLHVLYAVARASRPAAAILDRHIIRALEFGLRYHSPFSETIFELLKSNLHKFHAHFPASETAAYHGEQMGVALEVLATLPLPADQREDFLAALRGLADDVASGAPFDTAAEPAMGRQAQQLKTRLR